MHATAKVERLFSLINLTKTKPRNKLKTPTLEALMKVNKNIVDINRVCICHPEIIAKPIITKLGKDNQHSMISLDLQSNSDNPDALNSDNE